MCGIAAYIPAPLTTGTYNEINKVISKKYYKRVHAPVHT